MVTTRSTLLVLALMLALTTVLAACGNDGGDADSVSDDASGASATAPADAADVDLAPEFTNIDGWVNSEPLTLEELRGSPVLWR